MASMGCVARITSLLLLLSSAAATLIISNGSDPTTYSGSYLVFGIFPFDITAHLELVIAYDACEPLPWDLSGKIGVLNASTICTNTPAHDYISARANNVKAANALVK